MGLNSKKYQETPKNVKNAKRHGCPLSPEGVGVVGRARGGRWVVGAPANGVLQRDSAFGAFLWGNGACGAFRAWAQR